MGRGVPRELVVEIVPGHLLRAGPGQVRAVVPVEGALQSADHEAEDLFLVPDPPEPQTARTRGHGGVRGTPGVTQAFHERDTAHTRDGLHPLLARTPQAGVLP